MRTNGFYFVKYCLSETFEVAEYKSGTWYRTGFESKFQDWEFDIIGEQIELKELREKCKELTLQLNIVKTYFELALDRADPYPAIKCGLSRVNRVLGHEA